jgi:pimeloyl-ACP methyl ester carboxylesterase
METDIKLDDGRMLHFYDTGGPDDRLPVVWHHGTPNLGSPPEPLIPAAERLGVRWISYNRPAYGRSTPRPGRDVASAAEDVAAVADALRLERFAVMGHSGGSAHALACAALLPERVVAAVCMSGLAPRRAEGLDWFAGMGKASAAQLRAAVAGRADIEHYLATTEFDPELFVPADHEALSGRWAWLAGVAGKAIDDGPDGAVDDELAFVTRWGFEPARIDPPVLFVHGALDRIVPSAHSAWLARHTPSSELWLRPDDGHVSILDSAADALAWLRAQATGSRLG